MKLISLLPYLFDGTVDYAESGNARLYVNQNEKGGLPFLEWKFTDGKIMEPELQMITEDDMDDVWSPKRNPVNAVLHHDYYKTVPLFVGIEKLFAGDISEYVVGALLGNAYLTITRVDGTRVLTQVFEDGEEIPYVLDLVDIKESRFR